MGRLFQRNESSVDRIFRVLFGLFLVSLYFWGPKTPWAFVGIVPLATGLLGSCPAYSLFGINTCRSRRRQSEVEA